MILYLFLAVVSGLIFAMSLENLLGTQGDAKVPQTSEHAEALIIMSYINVVVFGLALLVSLAFLAKTFPSFLKLFVNNPDPYSTSSGVTFHHGIFYMLLMAISALLLAYGVITYQYEQENQIDEYLPPNGSCLGGSCNVMLINSIVFMCLSSLVILIQLIVGGYYTFSKVKSSPH